jgi:hypothetical protein
MTHNIYLKVPIKKEGNKKNVPIMVRLTLSAFTLYSS